MPGQPLAGPRVPDRLIIGFFLLTRMQAYFGGGERTGGVVMMGRGGAEWPFY